MFSLDRGLADALRGLDSCTISNVIETFGVRLRNEGFADGSVRCLFEDLPPIVGHAVTARIRCSTTPPVGHTYYDRTDWWNYILTVPAPRVVIAQDVDERPGLGALVGEVHANILMALGCAAYATNGSARDLSAVRGAGFQLFAGSVAISHAFVHILDFGRHVEIGGLKLKSGDIVFGDRYGIMTIPDGIVRDIPPIASDMRARESEIVSFCRSPEFSVEGLRSLIKSLG